MYSADHVLLAEFSAAAAASYCACRASASVVAAASADSSAALSPAAVNADCAVVRFERAVSTAKVCASAVSKQFAAVLRRRVVVEALPPQADKMSAPTMETEMRRERIKPRDVDEIQD